MSCKKSDQPHYQHPYHGNSRVSSIGVQYIPTSHGSRFELGGPGGPQQREMIVVLPERGKVLQLHVYQIHDVIII